MGSQNVSHSVSSQVRYIVFLIHVLVSTGRCLAHVINLVTQALLSAHSSAKHYDPAKPTDHEPDVDIFLRDEIGLVQAIVVNVSFLYFYCSGCSSKLICRGLDLLQSAKNDYWKFRNSLDRSQHSCCLWTWRSVGHLPIPCLLTLWTWKRYAIMSLLISPLNNIIISTLNNSFSKWREMRQTRRSGENSRRLFYLMMSGSGLNCWWSCCMYVTISKYTSDSLLIPM